MYWKKSELYSFLETSEQKVERQKREEEINGGYGDCSDDDSEKAEEIGLQTSEIKCFARKIDDQLEEIEGIACYGQNHHYDFTIDKDLQGLNLILIVS